MAESRLKPRRLSYHLVWRSAAQAGRWEPVSFGSFASPEARPGVLPGLPSERDGVAHAAPDTISLPEGPRSKRQCGWLCFSVLLEPQPPPLCFSWKTNMQFRVCMHTCSISSDSLRPRGLVARQAPCSWNFPGKNTGVGCHFLLQGISPAQGLNPFLPRPLHWQAESLSSSYLGSPNSELRYESPHI